MLRFGTDGVRGVANLELTAEVVLALGRAAARVLPASRFVVGRDTRLSGPLLESALVAGLMAEGADVEVLGVAPTPAVAWIAARDGIARSEEHTSELQSLMRISYAVLCLKKKKQIIH